jgi:hypothetical protein
MAVLHRPFRAQKAHVLFSGVCLYLCFVVDVAVLFLLSQHVEKVKGA